MWMLGRAVIGGYFFADFVGFVLLEFTFFDFHFGDFAFGRFFFVPFFGFVFERFFQGERSRFGGVAMRDGRRQ